MPYGICATIPFNPLMLQTFARATTIYVASGDTLGLLPHVHHKKAVIELATGSEDEAADSKADLAARLTLIDDGLAKARWQKLAKRLGIAGEY